MLVQNAPSHRYTSDGHAAAGTPDSAFGVPFRLPAEIIQRGKRCRSRRKDVERQALRTQAAEVFRHIFVLQHEMEWLTWHAFNRPKNLDSRMTAAYESTVHDAYPKVLGAMAILASMNIDLYQRLAPMVDRIYEMDGEIGSHITGLGGRRTRGGSLAKLKQLNEPVKAGATPTRSKNQQGSAGR